MARHETTGEIGAYPVEALIRPKDRVIWVLEFLDADGEAETFQTTDDHPWHVTDHAGFIETADLILGMRISTRDGRGMTLMSVTQTERTADTYNLTVTDAHTFFVGEDGAWVHNVDCDDLAKLPNVRDPKIDAEANKIYTTNNRPGDPIDVAGGGQIQILHEGASQAEIASAIELSRLTGKPVKIVGNPSNGSKVGDFVIDNEVIELIWGNFIVHSIVLVMAQI